MSELENYQASDFARQCGALLSKIPGVFSANVSEDELGDIAEIHILASTRRNAKQISRDVQSAIAAEMCIRDRYYIVTVLLCLLALLGFTA